MLSLQEGFYLCDLECRAKRALDEKIEAEEKFEKGYISLFEYAEARAEYKRANDMYIEACQKLIRNKRK